MTGVRGTIVRNASSAYAYRLVYGLVVLGLTTYLFRRLGASGFGTYSVIFTFATVFALLEVAYSNGISKLAAELVGTGRRDELVAQLRAALALAVGLGAVGLVVLLVLAVFGAGLAAPEDRDAYRLSMVTLAVFMAVRLPCMVYAAALMAHQRWYLLNAARIAAALVYAVGTVSAVEAGGGLAGAGVVLASYLLIEGILIAVQMRRYDATLPLLPRLADARAGRGIAAFTSYLLLADTAIFVGHRMQTVIIAGLRSAAAAAPFAAAVKLQTAVQSAVYPFVDLLIPMASDLHARTRRDELARSLNVATRAALQIALPLAVGLAVFSTDVVDAWLGEDAPSSTATIIAILMTVQIVTLTSTPAMKVLIGIGRVRLTAAVSTFEGLSNLALTLVFVSAHGAVGAAIPMLLTSALIAPFMIPIACRAIGASSREFVRTALWPPIASSLPGLGAMIVVWLAMEPSLARLVAGLGSGLGISAAIGLAQIGIPRLRAIAAEAF